VPDVFVLSYSIVYYENYPLKINGVLKMLIKVFVVTKFPEKAISCNIKYIVHEILVLEKIKIVVAYIKATNTCEIYLHCLKTRTLREKSYVLTW
jgi:hypothetical protein